MKQGLIPLDAIQFVRAERPRGKPLMDQVLLVDADLQPLCADTHAPRAPVFPRGFRGLPGERFDRIEDGRRVLVLGCGKPSAAAGDERTFWEGLGWQAAQLLHACNIERAELTGPINGDDESRAHHFAVGLLLAGYDNGLYRTVPARGAPRRRALRIPGIPAALLADATAVAEAVNWTRALVDAPASHLTPAAFAEEARSLAALGVQVEVLNEAALRKLGAHGLLAVGGSSVNKPCLVVAHWNGRRRKAVDLGIVGKGLTFDAGGLNLKAMLIERMKFDMGGAAAALGALRLLAQRGAAVNAVAVLPVCENIIAGDAFKPGDVIGSLDGLSIEVANTDAEGRIVLADGMAYAKRFNPRYLVDIATLTGSISMTLHQEFAGLFSADEELAAIIADCAERSGDLVWRMPLSPLQDYLVESTIADVRNLGAADGLGLPAGASAISAAKFLQRFAGNTRWAHLDMASTVLSSRQRGALRPGPTGWGVRLLVDLAMRIGA